MKLIIDGHVFGRSNEFKNITYWRCRQYRALGCLARASNPTKCTDVNGVFLINIDHNHGRNTN